MFHGRSSSELPSQHGSGSKTSRQNTKQPEKVRDVSQMNYNIKASSLFVIFFELSIYQLG